MWDVVIVGSGIAGLFTALNLDPAYQVLVLTKSGRDENNSYLAQGGIAMSKNTGEHFDDTLRAGRYHNQPEAVRLMVDTSAARIQQLLDWGVPFDHDETGQLHLTQEGGHSRPNILHAQDQTGRAIMHVLAKRAEKAPHIHLQTGVFVRDLITQDGHGILVSNPDGTTTRIPSRRVVLATGGIGALYFRTTNCALSTGDGIAIAHRAGLPLKDMAFIQFHPTALYQKTPGQQVLISEAVRGEGGRLRDHTGRRFMPDYDSRAELAPRDVVARAVQMEMLKANVDHLFLDLTEKPAHWIRHRFPYIYQACLDEGRDITREPIPITPSAHYIMGGIKTDLAGRTRLPGVYAVGECACTGLHGANRLASNSLLEALVFGFQIAKDANQTLKATPTGTRHDVIMPNSTQWHPSQSVASLRWELQQVMQKHASILRDESGLRRAQAKLTRLQDATVSLPQGPSTDEFQNMLTVGARIIHAALARKSSLGAHYRLDDEEDSSP